MACDGCGGPLVDIRGQVTCKTCGLVHGPSLVIDGYVIAGDSERYCGRHSFKQATYFARDESIGRLGSCIGYHDERVLRDVKGNQLPPSFARLKHRDFFIKEEQDKTGNRIKRLLGRACTMLSIPAPVREGAIYIYKLAMKARAHPNHIRVSAAALCLAARELRFPLPPREVMRVYESLGSRCPAILHVLVDCVTATRIHVKPGKVIDFIPEFTSRLASNATVIAGLEHHGIPREDFARVMEERAKALHVVMQRGGNPRGGGNPRITAAALVWLAGPKPLLGGQSRQRVGTWYILRQPFVAKTLGIDDYSLRDAVKPIKQFVARLPPFVAAVPTREKTHGKWKQVEAKETSAPAGPEQEKEKDGGLVRLQKDLHQARVEYEAIHGEPGNDDKGVLHKDETLRCECGYLLEGSPRSKRVHFTMAHHFKTTEAAIVADLPAVIREVHEKKPVVPKGNNTGLPSSPCQRVLTFEGAVDEPLCHSNRKYGLNIWEYAFTHETCTHATFLCRAYCYGKNIWRNILPRYARNIAESRKDGFVQRVVAQINRRGIQWIRIHEIGDFYDQAYFDKWIEIARQSPHTKIAAFTKNWEIDASKIPGNFIIYYSIDETTEHENPTIARRAIVFAPPSDKRIYDHAEPYGGRANTIICSSRCEHCKQCWAGTSDLAFPRRAGPRQFKDEKEPYILAKDPENHVYKTPGGMKRGSELYGTPLAPLQGEPDPGTIEGTEAPVVASLASSAPVNVKASPAFDALVALGFSREALTRLHILDYHVIYSGSMAGPITHLEINFIDKQGQNEEMKQS